MNEDKIEFFLQSLELKDEKRTGWQLRNIEDPETVADHTWGVTLLTLIHAPENLDRDKALKIATVHDLGETEIGDIAKRKLNQQQEISDEEKQQLEEQTVKKLSQKAGSDEILQLWKEYEKRETPEARFVKDMDLVDMCLTALKYEKKQRYDPEEENKNFQEYKHLDEFFATTQERLQTKKGQKLFREIKKKYQKTKNQNKK